MKKLSLYAILLLGVLSFTACQDKDIDIAPAKVNPVEVSAFTCQLQGDDYVISWPASLNLAGMQVTILKDATSQGSTEVKGANQFVHKDVPTNVNYTYILKAMDAEGNLSTGAILRYTRLGAASVTDLTMAQVDTETGYDVLVTWAKAQNLTGINFHAQCGEKVIDKKLAADETSFTIPNVAEGQEWNVSVVAVNEKGTSLSTKSSLKIGKTKIGYLSIYDTIEELVANGDDDEVAAWAWLKREYVSAQFVPFSSIASAETLEPFRVLFWMRDLEDGGEGAVFNMPQVVLDATPAIRQWYQQGGSMLLWSHATPYIEHLSRIPMGTWQNNDRNINTDRGGWNGDRWSLAVCLSPGENKFQRDHSGHPIFKGMRDVEYNVWGRTVLIPFKSGGFTEDHNCLFFNYPSQITGIGNQEEQCYDDLVGKFGIVPLGTWDSQINWVGQFNVWEAQGCAEHFVATSPIAIPATQGTVICIGNGGCNFNLKDEDGSFQRDLSKLPSSNNAYQDNINRLAKNSLEYLKTK